MELAWVHGEGMDRREEKLHEKCGNFPHFKQEIQVLSLHQVFSHDVCPSSVNLEQKKNANVCYIVTQI